MLDDQNKESKKRRDLRERAKKIMAKLTVTLESIQKISKHPERDFARIFQDEKVYFRMIEACNSAYEKGCESIMGLFNPANLEAIQFECWAAGLRPSAKQLSDRHFRNRILKELAAKEVDPGYSRLRRLRDTILIKKFTERQAYLKEKKL